QEAVQLRFVGGRGDGQVGHRPEVGEVEDPVVGRTVGAGHARPVEHEHDRQVVQCHVAYNLVVSPLEEGRIDADHRPATGQRQPGREGDGVLLADAYVIEA